MFSFHHVISWILPKVWRIQLTCRNLNSQSEIRRFLFITSYHEFYPKFEELQLRLEFSIRHTAKSKSIVKGSTLYKLVLHYFNSDIQTHFKKVRAASKERTSENFRKLQKTSENFTTPRVNHASKINHMQPSYCQLPTQLILQPSQLLLPTNHDDKNDTGNDIAIQPMI